MQALLKQELNVSELVGVLDQPQSTVSRHLKTLREADLIRDRREGTTIAYRGIEPAEVNGSTSDLRTRLLDWVATQPVAPAVARRLDAVLLQRRRRSEAFFEEVGQRWDQMRVDHYGTAFPFEALTALLPREWTVADIGVGTGYLLPLLATRFKRVIAIDPVPAMLEIAAGRTDLPENGNVEFVRGDLAALPMQDETVDLALAMLVLHHVSSPRQALQEIRRTVRPGGRLLVVEQLAHDYEEFYDRMQDRWWGFEPEALADHVTQVGFVEAELYALRSAGPTRAEAAAAPELFVLTARRPAEEDTN